MNLNKIKLIFGDIRLNLRAYIMLTVQSVIAFLVIGVILLVSNVASPKINALDSFDLSDNYYGCIRTEVYTNHGIVSGEEDRQLRKEIEYFIAENYEVQGSIDSYITYQGEEEGIEFVTEKFFDIFHLEVQEGRLFEKSEYGQDSLDNTPVILGAAYKDEYKLGDMYLDRFEIVGFLKDDSNIITLAGDLSSLFCIDNYICAPVKSLKCMKENNLGYPTELICAEDKGDLKKINDYANELGVYPYNYVSLPETKALINAVANQVNLPLLLISLMITLLALLCLIQSMLEFVKKNIVELLIHMMCGAKLSDIILRVGAGTALTAFISAAAASLVFRSASTTAVLFITATAVTVIAVLPVAVRLKLKPLIVAVKEEK